MKNTNIESEEFFPISLDRIETKSNIRSNYDENGIKELAESINEFKLLQPIRVYYEEEKEKYVVIFGHRRLLACQRLDLKKINCIIASKPDSVNNIFLQLVENMQKENISSADYEKYINLLKNDYKLSVEEIAKKISKSESYIYKILNALETREENNEIFIKAGYIPTTRQLIQLKNASIEEIQRIIDEVCEGTGKKTKIFNNVKRNPAKKIRTKNSKEKNEEINKDGKNIFNYDIHFRITGNDNDKTVIFKHSETHENTDSALMTDIEKSIKQHYEELGYKVDSELFVK